MPEIANLKYEYIPDSPIVPKVRLIEGEQGIIYAVDFYRKNDALRIRHDGKEYPLLFPEDVAFAAKLGHKIRHSKLEEFNEDELEVVVNVILGKITPDPDLVRSELKQLRLLEGYLRESIGEYRSQD